jgi:hypothetical protein
MRHLSDPAMRRHRWHSLTVCVALIASPLLLVDMAQPAAAAASAPSLAHSYTGSAHNTTASASGVLKLTNITQNGASIAGTLAFESPLSGTGPFTGTVSSTAVHFTARPTRATCSACASIVVTGEVTAIVSMRGSWVAYLNSGGSQTGTWGVGSTWNGTINSITIKKTAQMAISQMTENANGNIIGALITSGVSPLTADEPMGAGTITGSVHNNVVTFSAMGGCGPAVGATVHRQYFVGTLGTTGDMSGTWSYAGDTCGNYGRQHGTWQLHRSGASAPVV